MKSDLVVISWWSNCLGLACLHNLATYTRNRNIYVVQVGKTEQQKERFRPHLPPGVEELPYPPDRSAEDWRVREAVAAEFWPENQLEALTREEDETAESAPSEAPEPIIAGKIDIGAFAVEILASAINPYPRKADAEFVWDEGEAEKTGPFAALAKLRQDR